MDSSKQGMPPPDPYAGQGGYQQGYPQGYPQQPPPAYTAQPGCKKIQSFKPSCHIPLTFSELRCVFEVLFLGSKNQHNHFQKCNSLWKMHALMRYGNSAILICCYATNNYVLHVLSIVTFFGFLNS